ARRHDAPGASSKRLDLRTTDRGSEMLVGPGGFRRRLWREDSESWRLRSLATRGRRHKSRIVVARSFRAAVSFLYDGRTSPVVVPTCRIRIDPDLTAPT